MTWKIKFTEIAEKQFKKLDKNIALQIKKYLEEKILNNPKPRTFGKPLIHDKSGLWRYRMGNYRIICELKDKELIILVLQIGHRKDIYD